MFALCQGVAVVLIEWRSRRALLGLRVLDLGDGVDDAFDASAAHTILRLPVGVDLEG